MKYFLVTLLAFTSFMFSISAQTLNVSGIYEVPIEENAQIQPKLDFNDNPCAVLIFSLPSVLELQFKGNIIGEITRVGYNYIVNVPMGTKRITIFHEDIIPTTIEFSKYNIILHKGVNYNIHMNIDYPSIQSSFESYGVGSQYLIFKSDKKLALVKVNNEQWSTEGMTSKKMVPLGKYEYQIVAEDGSRVSGVVDVVSTKFSKVVNIKF